MRDRFPGWYLKEPEKLKAIWDAAIFVPDANVLLHCLRHPAKVRDELLRVFEVLQNSLWVPYQVGLEFQRNRLEVELGAQDAYEKLTADYEAAINQARERLRQLRAHPVINVEQELAALDALMGEFKNRMTQARDSHPIKEIASAVDRLTELLDGKVGEPWPTDALVALKKEGEDRYARKIPPGYRDVKKDGGDLHKFGDLIIWKDIMAKAKAEDRPVVFITDDAKEDWWWIHKGRKLGPRPELVEEFKAAAGQDFHIYEFPQFLRIAAGRHPEFEEAVLEVEKSLADDERARQRQIDAVMRREIQLALSRLEDERDQVVAQLSGTPTLDGPTPTLDRSALRARLDQLNRELQELEGQLVRLDETSTSSEVE